MIEKEFGEGVAYILAELALEETASREEKMTVRGSSCSTYSSKVISLNPLHYAQWQHVITSTVTKRINDDDDDGRRSWCCWQIDTIGSTNYFRTLHIHLYGMTHESSRRKVMLIHVNYV